MRSMDLDGLWRFQPDPIGDGTRLNYPSPAYDDHLWREVRIPADYATAHPGLEGYEGRAWYRRSVRVPQDWEGKRITLRAGGINTRADVWVNGQWVGRQPDPYLPFELRIDQALTFEGDNTLVIRTDNTREAGAVPGLKRGWRNLGGMVRGAEIRATENLFLGPIGATALPTAEGGELTVEMTMVNQRPEAAEMALTVTVCDHEGTELALWTRDPAAIPADGKGTVIIGGAVGGVEPWAPEHPHLYTVEVVLRQGERTVETRRFRVGFRTVEVLDGTLRLNGNPLFLTGFNRHEDTPKRAMSPDPEQVRRDLKKMKEAGANFVRLCHYPHDPGELELCDELGLLVMAEIPLYGWKGRGEGGADAPRRAVSALRAAERQLRAMIRRDGSRPSIILWSVSNEAEDPRPEVAAGNADLVRLARRLDPTRLAVHVSNHWRTHPRFTEDDVLCVNGYPGYDARRAEGSVELQALTKRWRTELEALHVRYPDKPILITEFGHPGVYGCPDGGFGTETQAEVLEHEYRGMDADYVCGTTIWCWADHPWPENTLEYYNRLNQSPFGVLTRDRREKQAYATVRDLFRARQGYAEPEPRTGPHASAAGYEVMMVRDHLNDIPQVPFPDGFEIRPMRFDEGGLWTDIWRDAEPFMDIGPEVFHRQFGDDLRATQWRSFIVTNPRGVAVGTISAWYNRIYKGRDYGQIHWVAVRKAYWGQGLGKAMLTHALNRMAAWHERAFLGTQTKRLGAIKIYLDFGFVPDLDRPGAVAAWREVKAQLDHPVLGDMDLQHGRQAE